VAAPTYEPRATGHIPEMIDLVQRLLDAGHAYVGESGNVYYDVRSLPAYGSLTNQRLEDLATTEDESQLDDDVEADKRDPRDFADDSGPQYEDEDFDDIVDGEAAPAPGPIGIATPAIAPSSITSASSHSAPSAASPTTSMSSSAPRMTLKPARTTA